MDDLIANLSKEMEAAISESTMTNARKQIESIMCDIESDMNYRIKENIASSLSYHVEEIVRKSIEAILRGDEELLRKHLSCSDHGYTGRENAISVGSIYNDRVTVSEAIVIRKQIVDAYPELLKNERILDLESQVATLIKEINKINKQFSDYMRLNA